MTQPEPSAPPLTSLPSWLHFPVIALTIEVGMLDYFRLPPYAGSMLRGILGWALKETCEPNLYAYLFETSSQLPGQTTAPRPFVLIPPASARTLKPQDRLSFQLRLLGGGCRYLPEFTEALLLAADYGLGSQHARFEVLKILVNEGPKQWVCFEKTLGWQNSYQPLPCALGTFIRLPVTCPSHIQILFETPTRLIDAGQPVLEPSFKVILRSIYRRLNAILEVHGGNSDGLSVLEQIELAQEVKAKHDLQWANWERTSSRQHKRHKMGGVTGLSSYSGRFEREWLAVLTAGEMLSIGKGATFGMGSYKVIFPG